MFMCDGMGSPLLVGVLGCVEELVRRTVRGDRGLDRTSETGDIANIKMNDGTSHSVLSLSRAFGEFR